MEDSLGPPKATVNAMIKELAGGIKFANNYSELVMEISQEFITQVSAEANKICLDGGKKTIAADHVFKALQSLKLDYMLEHLKESHDIFLKETESRNKSKNEVEEDPEEIKMQQKKLFEQSRNYSLSREASESLANLDNQTNAMNLTKTLSVTEQQPSGKAPQFKTDDGEDYENF